uniref:Peptidylglycine monooxygenase n=1 Tax=Globodera pallida TaxID=36090 RepID=A0A183BNG9_GLOPA
MIRLPLGNILLPILLSLLGPSHCWWHFGAKQPQTPSAPHNHGQLSLPSPALPELPEGVNAADLRMPGVSPQMNESYLCSAFPLNSDRDHFIVGFEPVPTSHHIHHMIVYGCELPGSGDEAWDCGEMASSRGRYSHSPVCSSQPDIIYAWALPQPREASTLLLATDGRIAPTKNEQLEVACVVDEPAVLHPFAFRVHTHRHGRKVAGWTVQEDPISDVLAARCTMENGEKREIKIGPTGEDEMCNFYLMYWTENGQNLEQNACFSPGPPEYRWTKNAGLNHTPKRK